MEINEYKKKKKKEKETNYQKEKSSPNGKRFSVINYCLMQLMRKIKVCKQLIMRFHWGDFIP